MVVDQQGSIRHEAKQKPRHDGQHAVPRLCHGLDNDKLGAVGVRVCQRAFVQLDVALKRL